MTDVAWMVDAVSIKRRTTDRAPYVILRADLIRADGTRAHRVELTASPTGRNLHVHVDGEPYSGGSDDD